MHSAPTREFSAYAEQLAALATRTRELAVHEAPTREFAAHLDDPLLSERLTSPPRAAGTPSGIQPRTRLPKERREEDATLKLGRGDTPSPNEPSAESLLRMLGPSPIPDLGNIEIYYRLGMVYLAAGHDVSARRCFLTVEGISPGYRDAAEHLAVIPVHVPTSSGETPVHYVVQTSGFVQGQQGRGALENDVTRGRRNGG